MPIGGRLPEAIAELAIAETAIEQSGERFFAAEISSTGSTPSDRLARANAEQLFDRAMNLAAAQMSPTLRQRVIDSSSRHRRGGHS